MTSVILQAASRVLQPLLLFFSVFLVARGHHQPGGGFVGGLVAAAAFALVAVAFGPEAARRSLRVDPRALVAAGLLVALAAGAIGAIAGEPFLTGRWAEVTLATGPLALGTPLLFDLGVYLLVTGVTLTIVFALSEE